MAPRDGSVALRGESRPKTFLLAEYPTHAGVSPQKSRRLDSYSGPASPSGLPRPGIGFGPLPTLATRGGGDAAPRAGLGGEISLAQSASSWGSRECWLAACRAPLALESTGAWGKPTGSIGVTKDVSQAQF